MLLTGSKLNFMYFYGFVLSGSAVLQAFGLILALNFHFSKFRFKQQANFTHKRKSLKQQGTLPGIPKMLCWETLVRLTTFYGLFAYKQQTSLV